MLRRRLGHSRILMAAAIILSASLSGCASSDGSIDLMPAPEVFDDGAVDSVLGDTEADWLLYTFANDSAADYNLAVDVRTDVNA